MDYSDNYITEIFKSIIIIHIPSQARISMYVYMYPTIGIL